MSLFLGKVHYWLFNKIVWFEGIESDLEKLGEDLGINVKDINSELDIKYGGRIPSRNLEEIIDKNNIHGWLQDRIHTSEGRVAAWTKTILNNGDNENRIREIYINQGKNAANEVITSGDNPRNAVEIFTKMNDYILDGMPCDRVNEIVNNEEENVQWRRRICVHKDIWSKEDIEVDLFYSLRSEWIKSFIENLNPNYEYVEDVNSLMEIRKKV